MDETLTISMLDYPAIRAEIGCEGPILEALALMDDARQTAAWEILHRHELAAAHASTLSPGSLDLLDWLATHRIPTALVTRNTRNSVDIVLKRLPLNLDVIITRDDAPHKPDPRPLLLACEKLNVDPQHVWMVGDGSYDIEAGSAAGIRTVWLTLGRQRHFTTQPWKSVRDLIELKEMLERCV